MNRTKPHLTHVDFVIENEFTRGPRRFVGWKCTIWADGERFFACAPSARVAQLKCELKVTEHTVFEADIHQARMSALHLRATTDLHSRVHLAPSYTPPAPHLSVWARLMNWIKK